MKLRDRYAMFVVMLCWLGAGPLLHAQQRPPVQQRMTHASFINAELEKVSDIVANDDAKAAELLLKKLKQYEMMAEKGAKNQATVMNMRMGYLLLMECQSVVNQVSSDEALAVYEKKLPRMDPWSALVILKGLDLSPTGIPDEFLETVERLAERGKDFRVQVAAVDFLGHHEQLRSQPIFFKLMKSKKTRLAVKISVVRQLAAMGDTKAIPELLELLEDHETGRLKYECIGAIRSLSGIEILSNHAQIQNWWKEVGATFQAIPPEKRTLYYNWEVQRAAEPDELVYYNIPIVASRLAFVIDQSGSMSSRATLESSTSIDNGEKLPPDASRLAVAKLALANLIGRLPKKNGFNILYFGTGLFPFNPKVPLMSASDRNKKLAYRFIHSAKPGGGTNTALAVELMLLNLAEKEDIGTIFLLTDGVPSALIGGRHTPLVPTKPTVMPVTTTAPANQGGMVVSRSSYHNVQADYFSFLNQGYKIRLNTVGIGAGTAEFLIRIANKNDGQYRAVE